MINYGKILLLAIFASASLMAGCSTESVKQEINSNPVIISDSIEKIEIYHFHGTSQCYSCKTVGAYAEETINTYFADELKEGKIVFGHINGELIENKEKVMQYGATGSSLWIGTYTKDGRFTAEQNVNVWYKINDKTDYMTYLKGVIDQKLAGN